MVSLHIIFGAEKQGQGNIFCLRGKLDGIVTLVSHRAAAAFFEIQGAPEDFLRFIIQCAFHIDFRMGLLPHMVNVVEEIQMLLLCPGIHRFFGDGGMVAL